MPEIYKIALYSLNALYFVIPFIAYYIKYRFQFSTLATYLVACALCFLTVFLIVFIVEQYLISVFLDLFNISKEEWDKFEFGDHYNKSPEEDPKTMIKLYKLIKIIFYIFEIAQSLVYVGICFLIAQYIEKKAQERYEYDDE